MNMYLIQIKFLCSYSTNIKCIIFYVNANHFNQKSYEVNYVIVFRKKEIWLTTTKKYHLFTTQISI